MSARKQNRSWRLFRIYFRRFRIGVWIVVILVLGSILYLNRVGLPDFVKRPLVEKLRARGIDLQFSRMRLHFARGIVADNVVIGGADAGAPCLTVREVQVRPDFAKLLHLKFQVNSLLLRHGRLVCPVTASNEPARELVVDNIQTELRFLPGDLWELDNFQAQFAGANVLLYGTVTNASAIRDWKTSGGGTNRNRVTLQEQLRELSDVLDEIHFLSAPGIKLEVFGDARDPSTFGANLTVHASGAETPWGDFEDGQLSARVIPPETRGELPRGELVLRAANARTRWASATGLDLTFHAVSTRDTNFNADLAITAEQMKSKWATASNARFSAQWIHSPTQAVPISGRGEFRVGHAESAWGNGDDLQFIGWLATPANPPAAPDISWNLWTNIAPYALNFDCRIGLLSASNAVATNILCAAQWLAPRLEISHLSARLYEGGLVAQAKLDVATRELTFTDSSDFDAQKISSFLTPMARHWLAQFSWDKPPQLEASGGLLLPPWGERHPDWRAEVKPTITLAGHIAAGPGAFRGVPYDSATLHFTYTNLFWRLPDLVAIRPEGRLEMLHESNEATEDYYFRFHSTADVRAIRPLLEPEQRRGFDLAEFNTPPVIEAEVRGRWHEPETIGVNASIAVTNCAFRGETMDTVRSQVTFTNNVISFIQPEIERGTQHLSAASILVDLNAEKVFLTNGVSTADPAAITRVIGPLVTRVMEPYHFLRPPLGHVEGVIPFHDHRQADLHFDVDGGAFEWWKFKVPRIAGRIDWVGDKLDLRGLRMDFYGGAAAADAEFDFTTNDATACRFDVVITNADLHWLMTDLDPETNRLEGALSGRLTVTHGIAENSRSWKGFGRARLENGFIWELPVFGVLSPALDGIAPGLGSARATEGSAAYVISNGRVYSDDLAIRATGMRLQYRGNVAFDGAVDARVEAELLRNTWVVGKVLSMALWPVSKIFGYKISGTLAQPKMEPLYFVPRLILMPLHPFETMKDLFPRTTEPTGTNSVPANGP